MKSVLRWTAALAPVVLLVIVRTQVISEGDVFWETRAGLDAINGARFQHLDFASWSAAGQLWTPNSWAWNVILARVWNQSGTFGLGLLALGMSLTLVMTMAVTALRLTKQPLAIAIALLLSGFGLAEWLSPRPQIATYLAAAISLPLLTHWLTARRNSTRWLSLGALAVIQVFAINLHFGAVSVVAIIAGASLGWFAKQRSNRPMIVALYIAGLPVIVTLAMTLVNPLGVHIFSHALSVRNTSQAHIDEWASGLTSFIGLPTILIGALLVRQGAKAGRWIHVGALVCAIVLSIGARRFLPLIAIYAAPELAICVATHNVSRHFTFFIRPAAIAGMAILSTILLVTAVARVPHFGAPLGYEFSRAATTALPTGCRVLNEYNVGGYIELYRPDIHVSIDGRNDFFGGQEVQTQHEVWTGKDAVGWLNNNEVNCVLGRNSPRTETLRSELTNSGEWDIKDIDQQFVATRH